MASSTLPPSLLDLQSILDSAFKNLGQVRADVDYQQQRANAALSQNISESNVARGKATTRTRENDSARGLLNSGIALNDQADVNLQYDKTNAGYQTSYDDLIHQLAQKRLAGEDAYNVASLNFEHQKTQMEADSEAQRRLNDPYDWGGIMNEYQQYGLMPDPINDPHGWKLIDAKKKAAEQGNAPITSTNPRPNNQALSLAS